MKKYWKYISNKYIICTVVLIAHICITVDTNVFELFKVKSDISELSSQNNSMRAEIEEIDTATEELTTNIKAKEKYARETYFMKKSNEDIFVFVEE